MRKILCPKCESGNIEISKFAGIDVIICHECKYDERDLYLAIGLDEKENYQLYRECGKRKLIP